MNPLFKAVNHPAALSRPPMERLVFSGRVLFLFILLGPLIALMATEAGIVDLFRTPMILLPTYMAGAFHAFCAWLIYSVAFAGINHARAALRLSGLSWTTSLALGAVVGALGTFAVFLIFICALVPPGMQCVYIAFYRASWVSLVTGVVCGALAVLLVSIDAKLPQSRS